MKFQKTQLEQLAFCDFVISIIIIIIIIIIFLFTVKRVVGWNNMEFSQYMSNVKEI